MPFIITLLLLLLLSEYLCVSMKRKQDIILFVTIISLENIHLSICCIYYHFIILLLDTFSAPNFNVGSWVNVYVSHFKIDTKGKKLCVMCVCVCVFVDVDKQKQLWRTIQVCMHCFSFIIIIIIILMRLHDRYKFCAILKIYRQ